MAVARRHQSVVFCKIIIAVCLEVTKNHRLLPHYQFKLPDLPSGPLTDC